MTYLDPFLTEAERAAADLEARFGELLATLAEALSDAPEIRRLAEQ